MSDLSSAASTLDAAGAGREGGSPASWEIRRRQIAAVLRLEIRKRFLGKRALWLYLLALAPVAILILILFAYKAMPDGTIDLRNIGKATEMFAVMYQTFILRIVVFLGCVAVFGNLIRREVLERSLHYYFLSPMRRELLVVAKYLTGVVVTVTLFGLSTVASYLLAYLPYESGGVERFFFQGPGFAHLGSYLLVTVLACIGYGALFLAFGFFFRSPAIPALAVFGWEAILFLLPPLLKKVTVLHYLHALCPVPVSDGPMALLADAPSPWVAIPGLFLLAAVLVALSARKIRGMEIKYEED
jgi:ABC-type transport system involved in multi-copper enzyme maturation permease subunit